MPSAISGLAVARALDDGFLAGRPMVGMSWLAAMLLAAAIGAVGSRKVLQHLGDLTEPFRDDLISRVVDDSLQRSVAGHTDDGALTRLTHQVEIVRDTYSRLLVVILGFVVTVGSVVAGLVAIAPAVVLLIVPPFLLAIGMFLATLGVFAPRQRAVALAEDRLASAAGSVLAAIRDMVASGAEEYAATTVTGPIAEHATAERSLSSVASLRTLCFAVGGWLPLLIVLFAGPWLVGRGLTTGAILGGLIYVVFGLQPTLRTFIAGVGDSGLRFVMTLGRILDESAPPSTFQAVRSKNPPSARAGWSGTVGGDAGGWAYQQPDQEGPYP
ncbi:MAG TPA: ABC transporter transmembrane domain-containing protein [Pseudonocardiaceae bacterium]|nr:ABC transporter transmembrane domain-containing protein [Pseudonocardiaceae bacterium]